MHSSRWWTVANGDATTTIFLHPDADDDSLIAAVDAICGHCAQHFVAWYTTPFIGWDRLIVQQVTAW